MVSFLRVLVLITVFVHKMCVHSIVYLESFRDIYIEREESTYFSNDFIDKNSTLSHLPFVIIMLEKDFSNIDTNLLGPIQKCLSNSIFF